jgi:hypothetical protein
MFFIACQQEAQTERPSSVFMGIPPEVEELMQRADATLSALEGVRYKVLYTSKSADASDTTFNVYAVLLKRVPELPFGFMVFASNFAGYHVVYDGTQVIAGVPSTGFMTLIDSTEQPGKWMETSFAKDIRLGLHHEANIIEKIRVSQNILSMELEKTSWEEKPSQTLHIQFGAKPPVTGGRLDIVFRSSDALPVSVVEILELEINGQAQRQILRTDYVEIEKNPAVAPGQFSRGALPDDLTFE